MSEWKIVGIGDDGERETLYEGADYSNVSDMMDENESRYSRIESYKNGHLDQAVNCSPARGLDVGWIFLLIIVIAILGSLFIAH